MASLRLALKASMEEMGGDKKPTAAAKAPKAARGEKEKDGSMKTTRGETSARTFKQPQATSLAELPAFKMPRKDSRLSDTHSVSSDDSGKGSIQSAVSSVKKYQSGDDTTPVKKNVPRKRQFDAVKLPSEAEESPAKRMHPGRPVTLKREKKVAVAPAAVVIAATEETVVKEVLPIKKEDSDNMQLNIDIRAVKKAPSEKKTEPVAAVTKPVDTVASVVVQKPEPVTKETEEKTAMLMVKDVKEEEKESVVTEAIDSTTTTAPTATAPTATAPPAEVGDSLASAHTTPHRIRNTSDGEIFVGGAASTSSSAVDSGDEDDDVGIADGALTPRHNKRAAAVMAKTKLNTRKHLNAGELEKDLLAAGISAPAGGEENTLDETAIKGTKSANNSAKKLANRIIRAQKKESVAAEAVVAQEEEKFAACDVCEKWRKLPQHVDTSTLPEKWVCSMNIWDSDRNTCEAAEEDFPEPAMIPDVSPKEPLENVEDSRGPGKNKHKGGGSSVKKRRLDSIGGEDIDGQEGGGEVKKKGHKRISDTKSPKILDADIPPLIPEQWVQCDKCSKWRKAAPGVDPDDLPKVWYCNMNTWNPVFARCGARQEKTQEKVPTTAGGSVASGDEFAPPTGRGKYVRKPQNAGDKQPGDGLHSALFTPVAPTATALGAPGLPVKKVTQWVQCERKNCQKWRKVGASIDMESLPEKWFCEMNNWDYDRATCDAPEEDASDNEGGGGSGISTQLIVGNSKGANALSYRRLIFSQDGRLRPLYSEKNKYGHGIFSYSELHTVADSDEYIAPTRCVGYWWSSLYDDVMGAEYSTGSKRHPTVSVPGAKKEKEHGNKGLIAANSAAQHEFHVIDDVTVVSKRDCWPSLIEQQPLPYPDADAAITGGSFHMVDAYRKMHRMRCPVDAPVANAIQAKHVAKRSLMSLQDILRTESSVVRSCLSLALRELEATGVGLTQAVSKTAADGAGSVSLGSIWSTIQSARFLTDNEEACRACMSAVTLKEAIHRLEETDVLRVTFASSGELCIHPLQPLSEIIQSRKMKHAIRDKMNAERIERNQKGGNAAGSPSGKKKSKYVSSTVAVDPTFGTPYYWAPRGEKEYVVNKMEEEKVLTLIPAPVVVAAVEVVAEPIAQEQGEEFTPPTAAVSSVTNGGGDNTKVCTGGLVLSTPVSTPAPVVVPVPAIQQPQKQQSVVFGSVRPPLKLRKLLKSYYCTTKTEK